MNNSIYDNYNTDNNSSNPLTNSTQNTPSSNYYHQNTTNENINNSFKNIENDLCDMKVTLAETKANLLFLAQTLCNRGTLYKTEKTLLLNIDQSLKLLNCKVNDSKVNVDYISSFL